jgi:hypothetical protein
MAVLRSCLDKTRPGRKGEMRRETREKDGEERDRRKGEEEKRGRGGGHKRRGGDKRSAKGSVASVCTYDDRLYPEMGHRRSNVEFPPLKVVEMMSSPVSSLSRPSRTHDREVIERRIMRPICKRWGEFFRLCHWERLNLN